MESGGKPRPSGTAGPGLAAETIEPLPPDARESLVRYWKWLLVSGTLAIFAGLVAISVPALASVFTATFIGWVILFSSIFMFVDAMAPPRTAGRVLPRLLYGALMVFVGIYLLAAPLEGTVTLTFVLAVWFIALGVLRLIAWYGQRDRRDSWVALVSGLASLALGLLIAVELPSSADWAIGLLVGIDFLFYGFTAVWTAWAGRELAKSGAPEGAPGA